MSGIHEPGTGPPGETCETCHFFTGVVCRLSMHFYDAAFMAAAMPLPMALHPLLPACKSWASRDDVYLPLHLWDKCLDVPYTRISSQA